jgi:hypothetical protein
LPDARYRVQLDAGDEVVAYTAGKTHIQRVGNGAPDFELPTDASARRLPTLLRLVMRGQKRVEDARKRAYDPRIHLLRKKFFAKMDGLPGQARQ